FSEAVKEFDSGDVLMRIGDEEYGLASLKDFKAMGVDDKQWQASYTTPSDTDTKVTFKIENDSYLSKNNVPGKGAELTLDIKGTKPQVSSVELPDSATVRETINVSVTFTEEVTKPLGSTLGDAAVTWSEDDELREVWTGEVTVPSTDVSTLTLNLSIKGYQDKYANVGVENTNNSVSLNHVLSINSIGNVGQNSPKTIAIGGQWAHLQGQLTLTVSSKNYENVPLSGNGTWRQAVSIEGLPQGSITVTVSGNNAKGEVVKGAVQTFIFDDAAPVIDDESLTVSRDDENGTVTLGFDIQDEASGLSQVTYQFNGKEITKDSADKTQLPLAADDLAGKDELKIRITAFDSLGQKTEVAKTINIAQPKVSLSLQGAVDLTEGGLPLTQLPQSITLTAPSAEGSVVQAAGYRLALVPSDESGNTVTLSELKLPSGSTDSTAEFNLAASQIPQGEFTLCLVVTDSLGREIEQFTYSDETYGARGIPVLVDFVDPEVSDVDWKTSQASAGEAVEFTVTFSEPVNQPAGSTLGDEAVIWSEGDELHQEWTGQVTVPVDVDTSLESLTLSVKGYADRVGNSGNANREYSLPLNAPVEIPDNSGAEGSLETPQEDSERSELDPGSSESEIEETRLAA
ncbi:hypothetical protein, partial [Vibrio hepatarius]|uniref:hypothetical protein n=1 Tax=Vibrio hepatarius TaxID=171383 RepID=UPI001C0975C6